MVVNQENNIASGVAWTVGGAATAAISFDGLFSHVLIKEPVRAEGWQMALGLVLGIAGTAVGLSLLASSRPRR